MITVVGLGFVGLTTALGLAEKGFKVFGFDKDVEKVREYSEKRVPFHEPGLQEMLSKHLGQNFILAHDITDAVCESEVVFYCVGTPSLENGEADLSQLFGAFDDAVRGLSKSGSYKVHVIKSTVPPGSTGVRFASHVERQGFVPGETIGISNNPEFLREGHAWNDFIEPDRIVIGTSDDRSTEILKRIYGVFSAPIHCVSLNTGEFIKYLSNTMLATMISFANEMSMIAHRIGDIDITRAFRVLHEDKRWSGLPANMATYVYPGCGYGGYCLPKDTTALYHSALENGYEAKLIGEVINTNEKIKEFAVDMVSDSLSFEATVGILGLAFKPDSDDVRDSPAAAVIEKLLSRGFKRIVVYDPVANDAFARLYGFPLIFARSIDEFVECADRILIVTSWPIFKESADMLMKKDVYDFRYFIH